MSLLFSAFHGENITWKGKKLVVCFNNHFASFLAQFINNGAKFDA
jgi:hypothetical protein